MRIGVLAVAIVAALVTGLPGTAHAGASGQGKPSVAGGEINGDQLPWIVSVWGSTHTNASKGKESQLCGGALIAPRWVLTAAHCIDLAGGTMTLRIGANKRGEGAEVKAVRAVKHPSYDAQTMSHDIGLLELADGMQGAAPLPLRSFPLWESAPVRALGWGVTGGQQAEGATELRYVDTTVVAASGCDWAAPLFHAEQMYCYSAAEMKLPCLMDSGGPVIHRDGVTGRWSLVGLINGGDSYCPYGTDYPWFGVGIEHFREWIISQTGRLHAPAPF